MLRASAEETTRRVDTAGPGRRFSFRASSILWLVMVPKCVGGMGVVRNWHAYWGLGKGGRQATDSPHKIPPKSAFSRYPVLPPMSSLPHSSTRLPDTEQVRRVTTELKRYQLRHPRAAAEAAAEVGDVGRNVEGHQDADDLPPWVTSSEVMSPLLAAYDARIEVK